MVCWSTKAAISLKRVKIEDKLLTCYVEPIGTHQRSFEWYHPRPPMASSSPRLWVRNPHPKFQSLFSGRGEVTDFKFGISEQKLIKNFGEKGAWDGGRIQALTKFWGYPQLSQDRVKVQTSNFARTFTGSIRTKAHYKFWRRECGRIKGLSNFWGYPYCLRNS